jgi:hypothetical protein
VGGSDRINELLARGGLDGTERVVRLGLEVEGGVTHLVSAVELTMLRAAPKISLACRLEAA